jgi:hypothetical protein
MSLHKSRKSGRRPGANNNSRTARNKRLRQINENTSEIIKHAAALLDEEVAAGIVVAEQMRRRFQKERRIDPGDFERALHRFQRDAHEVVSLLDEHIDTLGSQENTNLAKRLVNNTHSVVDLAVELINLGTEITNQLLQSNFAHGVRGSASPKR